MKPVPSSAIPKALAVTAEIYGREFSESAARLLAADLSEYPEDAVLTSLARCRRELRSFPTLADILARIDDGRPGTEEAWAMIPHDEASSVVWTEEMAEAFGGVRFLVEVDDVAARMSFREIYLRLVTEARNAKRPAKWFASLGTDSTTHEPALKAAVAKGRLTMDHAYTLLPHRPVLPIKMLEQQAAAAPNPEEVQEHLAKIKALILKTGDA